MQRSQHLPSRVSSWVLTIHGMLSGCLIVAGVVLGGAGLSGTWPGHVVAAVMVIGTVSAIALAAVVGAWVVGRIERRSRGGTDAA